MFDLLYAHYFIKSIHIFKKVILSLYIFIKNSFWALNRLLNCFVMKRNKKSDWLDMSLSDKKVKELMACGHQNFLKYTKFLVELAESWVNNTSQVDNPIYLNVILYLKDIDFWIFSALTNKNNSFSSFNFFLCIKLK